MINNIKYDRNNAKPGSGNEKVFNGLKKLINDVSNKKVKKECAIKRMKENYSRVRTTKAKRKYCFSEPDDSCSLLFV